MCAISDQKTYLGCTGLYPLSHLAARVDLRTNISPIIAPRKVRNCTLAILVPMMVLKVVKGVFN